MSAAGVVLPASDARSSVEATIEEKSRFGGNEDIADMQDSSDSKLGKAIQELVWRVAIEGTPVREYEAARGGFTTYRAPWCVIDKAESEPEINWPGRLVGASDDYDEARKMQVAEIGRLAREELGLMSAIQ